MIRLAPTALISATGSDPAAHLPSPALHALFGIMRLDLSVCSRRSLKRPRRSRPDAGQHGGTGQVSGRPRVAAATGTLACRRDVHTLTEATGDDATTALDLSHPNGPLVRITADAAYDTVAVYQTATGGVRRSSSHRARTATVSGHGPRSPARDRTITLVKQLGRRRWKKTSGYHRQSRPGERVLPIHVHRRWPSRPESNWTGE